MSMDIFNVLGIVLVVFGCSTFIGAGFGFHAGYKKGQVDSDV